MTAARAVLLEPVVGVVGMKGERCDEECRSDKKYGSRVG